MTIDISTHKTILFRILKEIYSDTSIAPFLGFKGGTAALMFYGLDRFSVDLDFDLLDDRKEDVVFENVVTILKKYGTLRESHKKRFNLFCVLSYEEKAQNIKVEINRRRFGSQYVMKTYLGVSMLVMKREDMVAHKLMAMHERIGKTARDIYDVWYFLAHNFSINKELVEKRSSMSFQSLVKKCVTQLKKLPDRSMLVGIGELLTDSQKKWVKANLKNETIALLTLKSENLKKYTRDFSDEEIAEWMKNDRV